MQYYYNVQIQTSLYKIKSKNIANCLTSFSYDIVKVQLLQLIQLYTQKSYVLEEEFSKGVFTIVYNLIVQQATSDICLM